MKYSRWFSGSIVLLLVFVWLGTGLSVEQELKPRLEFEEILYDFGKIQQGNEVKHQFQFKNTGNTDLVIISLKSSCGCTAAIASTGPYKPGESGFIEVNYNSHGKFGYTHKEVQVYSNDPTSPLTVALEGVVIAEQHPQTTAADVLFQGSCAECHSIPAKNKMGEKLYDSACALCHDFPQSVGKPAIARDRVGLSDLSKKDLKRIIKQGIPQTSMPAFGEKSGGPLTKDQIKSLLEYLSTLKSKKEGG